MTEQYNRQLLLNEVWSEPIVQVARRYGMSNAALTNLCSRLQIPTPPMGHWAKLKAGKHVVSKPTLQDFTGHPGQLHVHHRGRGTHEIEVVDLRLQRIIDYEQYTSNRITVDECLTKPHPLVEQTRDALKTPFFDQRDLPVPRGKALDFKVSKAMLPRALRVADALIKAVEMRGYSVAFAEHHAEFNILGVSLSVCFFEPASRSDYVLTAAESAKKARGEWVDVPKPTFTPSGKLQLISDGKVSDLDHSRVEDRLNDFVVLLARQAVKILVRQEQQAAEEANRRRERDEALALQAKQDAERAKLKELEDKAQAWKRAALLREYLIAFEAAASNAGGLTPDQASYLAWARAKADWLDPLRNAPDLLLDLDIEVPRLYGW